MLKGRVTKSFRLENNLSFGVRFKVELKVNNVDFQNLLLLKYV